MRCLNCIDNFCTNRCDLDVRTYRSKFQVSSCGLIWRVKKGQLYRIQPYDNRGVLYVDLYMDGGQKRLGEIMLESFGFKGTGRIVYLDGEKKNCNIDNLKWSK